MKRWLLLGFVCVAASLPSAREVHTQDEGPRPSLLVRSDGSAWWWAGPGSEPRPLPELPDVEAAGMVGDQALLARAGGAAWIWSPDPARPLSRVTPALRIRSLACDRLACLAVTGLDGVVTWRGADAATLVRGLEDVAAVALAGQHALALSHAGQVSVWDLDRSDRPVPLPDLFGIESIAAGARHGLAASYDGSVWAWGANHAGQLGVPGLVDRVAPVRVPGIGRAVQVAALGDRSFVLTEGGEVWTFGAGRPLPLQLKSPGEVARLHLASGTVLAERADGRFWDCLAQTELRFADLPGRAPLSPPAPPDGGGLTGTAALLVGARDLSAADAFIARRLEALGLTVAVVDPDDRTTALGEASIVVVSSSVEARGVDGPALAKLAVPVVSWERFLFAPMGLTSRERLASHASTIDRRLSILRPGHPLAAGLEGHVAVLRRAAPLTAGAPGPGGQVVAVDREGRPAVFAYEAGAPTALGPAAARRVGLFLPPSAGHSLTADGAALFDAAVRWALEAPETAGEDTGPPESPTVSGTVLLVVGNTTLSTGDAVYAARIAALGFTVQVKAAAQTVPADANGKAMVLVSTTCPNGDVNTKFTNATVGVAVMSAGMIWPMQMVDPALRGSCVMPLNITFILDPTHPIAGGLSGLQTISGTPGAQQWGNPTVNARRITRCDTINTQNTGFTYDSGAGMYGLNAPARRTLWSFFDLIPSTYTQVGKDLFDRMILWTSNTSNQAPIVNAGPDQAATTCEEPPCTPITLPGHVFDDGLPGGPVTVLWERVSGTGPVTFTSPNTAVTGATFENTGQHVLRLTASDGVFSSSDTVVITVYGQSSNQPPTVNAGPDVVVQFPNAASLTGSAIDEGLPNPPGALTYQWSRVSGPGTVTFAAPNAAVTTATFSVQGKYVLRLTASDSILTAYDDMEVVSNKAVLLVVGTPSPLTPGETVLKSRIEALGFPVIVRDDNVVQSNEAANKAFVWLSSTVDSELFTGPPYPFSTVAIPVVVQTSGYVDNLGMTTGATGTSGNELGQSQVRITAPTHPLSTGLTGTVTTSAAAQYDWGVPHTTAVGVARVLPDPLRYAVFSYEQWDIMASGDVARERRLFFGLHAPALANLRPAGRRLLDAAILWMGRTNSAPWVEAGPPIITPATTVSLAGAVVDDGLPNPPGALTISWQKVTGPGNVSFGSPSQPATTATFSTTGDYVLRLTAFDGAKVSSDLAFVTILVPGANAPPSVTAGPDQTIRFPQKASLAAVAADDGLPIPPGAVSVTWSKVYGPGTVSFAPPNALSTTATFPGPGVYVLRATVSDSLLTASDDVQVTVEATRPALFVVGSDAPMFPDDARIKQELEASGFTVVLKNHVNVAHTDADDKDVVLISSSIPSGAVGSLFLTKAKPVVLWENQLYDDMGMTAAPGGVAAGDQVLITAPGHPLAANLSGTQTVHSSPANLDWGIPGPYAIKAATLVTDASKATVFAYERGSTMASGLAAPARRVGVFASGASLYTNVGAALFRAAVKWATERPATVLLVVPSTPLSPSDQAVKERIAAHGFGVTVVTGAAAVSADAVGKAFVVISNAPAAADKFLRATTAVVVWDGQVMADMGMVPPTPGVGWGAMAGQTKVSIVQQLHPLSAGLTGLQTVTTASDIYGWGIPTSAAAKVATLEGDASKATIFGYEIRAALHPSFARPAAADRRVGLFLGPGTGVLLTAEGERLLDAALNWAADSDPDADGLGTADEYRYGTNPLDADSNDDGLLDGAAVEAGISPTSLDIDGDGLTNAIERSLGTDPFNRDTDGDTALAGDLGLDGADCFPLDPTRWLCPPPVPGDVTPPIIQLREPVTAVPTGSVP